MADVALSVLRKAITVSCLAKGLALSQKRDLYFPEGLIPGNRLKFTNYDGTKTFVSTVGERTFKSGLTKEVVRYHLSPRSLAEKGLSRPALVKEAPTEGEVPRAASGGRIVGSALQT